MISVLLNAKRDYNTMKDFRISDYYDLLNLHKALMEAKFHDNPENEYIAGSPVIAKIMKQIADLLSELSSDVTKSDWDNWRDISQRRKEEQTNSNGIWNKMIKRAANDCMWNRYSPSEKRKFAQIYLSPFIASEQDLEDFISNVDEQIEINNQSGYMNNRQKKFAKYLSDVQEQVVESCMAEHNCTNEETRKMLYEATYDMAVGIMEAIDGYSSFSSDKYDIVNTVTDERLKENPFIELHDILEDYLKKGCD